MAGDFDSDSLIELLLLITFELLFLLKTIGLAVLGVLLSSYQLFADLLQYAESPRVGGESSLFTRLLEQPMFGLADDVMRFTTVFRSFGNDIIGNGSNFRLW